MTAITGYPNGFPGGVTRVHGDADGVVNVDIALGGGVDPSGNVLIATGLTKHPTAYKIIANVALDQGVGSAVESILRKLQVAATVVMYQVAGNVTLGGANDTQLSVLVEAQGFGSDANVLAALSGNVNTASNTPVSITSVSSANGFMLA